MKRLSTFAIVVCLGAPDGIAGPAQAQDASFGCKVLLCAAATAPGWAGIPYCVPVMQTLFRQLARGGGWPSCPEGHASGIGYEPFQACPTGRTPMQSAPDGRPGLIPERNGNFCADLSRPSRSCAGGEAGCGLTYPTTARDPRSDPYYVDIATGDASKRFYFSLQGH
jgi:hypothetical protein